MTAYEIINEVQDVAVQRSLGWKYAALSIKREIDFKIQVKKRITQGQFSFIHLFVNLQCSM